MKPIQTPTQIEQALQAGAALSISISGGKDSQALAYALKAEHDLGRWPGPIFLIHADLGRAEWEQTPAQVRALADELGLELVVVARDGGDLVQRIEARRDQLQAKGQATPFWPSSDARYCTSDLKRDPINKYLRRYASVVSAEGVRADESTARARKPVYAVRSKLATQTRQAFDWRPLLAWDTEDVLNACGSSGADLDRRRKLYAAGERFQNDGPKLKALDGWKLHPAYVYGNVRLSCVLCVLACEQDLRNGAKHNPTVAATYLRLEREGGYTFRANKSLADILAQ